MGLFTKLFGTRSEREVKKLEPQVEAVMALEEPYKKLTDQQLREKTQEFKDRLATGETLDDLLPEAFAVCREAASRVLGMRPYRVQVVGGIVLHQGRIAEMKTGEGKTLVAILPAYLNALSGEGVHVVTVNDYLAKFQGEDIGRIFRFLGMSVGVIVHDLSQEERKAEKWFGVENLADIANSELMHHINAALKAHALMKRDVDYVVQNDQVIIVDEFTGRLMVGRRYSDGLHQAIEAKEHVKVERESKTLATITFQNYFRMYKKLPGMTGTAKTEEDEFKGIYALDVVQIPTNRPMIRKDMNDLVYTTVKGKFLQVVDEIENRHKTGQPILVGTVSVEVSELLSKMLKMRGIQHEVLNAKYHEKEAEIIAQAGHFGAVTIATNMAGRGTDILLGGNPEYLARRAMKQKGYDEMVIEDATGFNENVPQEVLDAREVYKQLYADFKKQTDAEHDRVVAVGGLHIIGTERHESRRIDNQLRGRAGRQGDPGSSQFFISMQDDLMRLFGSDKVSGMIAKLGVGETEPIEAKMLTGQIENAQKRIEGRNYEIRKNVLQYDDVMNEQRKEIYEQRRQVLEGRDMHDTIATMADKLIDAAVALYCGNGDDTLDWDMEGLKTYMERLCARVGFFAAHEDKLSHIPKDELTAMLKQEARDFYAIREEEFAKIGIDTRELERVVLLTCVDKRWMDHIDAMDQLRDGIGLRAFANRNPITEYQLEGYDMFDEMVHLIREDTVRRMYQARINVPQERKQVAEVKETNLEQAKAAGGPAGTKKVTKKPGRNDPCPCGSGKKYKNCCGKEA